MRRMIILFLSTTAAPGVLAHEIHGADNLLQALHAATSPHHWAGLVLLFALAALLYRFLRRESRPE